MIKFYQKLRKKMLLFRPWKYFTKTYEKLGIIVLLYEPYKPKNWTLRQLRFSPYEKPELYTSPSQVWYVGVFINSRNSIFPHFLISVHNEPLWSSHSVASIFMVSTCKLVCDIFEEYPSRWCGQEYVMCVWIVAITIDIL